MTSLPMLVHEYVAFSVYVIDMAYVYMYLHIYLYAC